MKTVILILIFSLSFYGNSFSQEEIITNKSIQDMVKAGLENEIIIGKINSAVCKFDLSTNALIILKNNKVPNPIIQAMMNKKEITKTSENPNLNTLTKDDNQKNSESAKSKNKYLSLAPGIYYEDAAGNLKALEPSTFGQSKSGSGLLTGLTYGAAKTKSKSVLSGIHSNFEINNTNPSFYFVFPKPNPNDNNFSVNSADGKISSPKEFALIKFTVVNTNKSKGREVVTGSWNYGGSSGGFEDENLIKFKYEKVVDLVYKIQFEKTPDVGEYAFIHAGGAAAYGAAGINRAFDFSIIK